MTISIAKQNQKLNYDLRILFSTRILNPLERLPVRWWHLGTCSQFNKLPGYVMRCVHQSNPRIVLTVHVDNSVFVIPMTRHLSSNARPIWVIKNYLHARRSILGSTLDYIACLASLLWQEANFPCGTFFVVMMVIPLLAGHHVCTRPSKLLLTKLRFVSTVCGCFYCLLHRSPLACCLFVWPQPVVWNIMKSGTVVLDA